MLNIRNKNDTILKNDENCQQKWDHFRKVQNMSGKKGTISENDRNWQAKRYHLREISPNLYGKKTDKKVKFGKNGKVLQQTRYYWRKVWKITNKTGTISLKSQNSATKVIPIWEIYLLFVEKLYLSLGKNKKISHKKSNPPKLKPLSPISYIHHSWGDSLPF